MNSTVGHKGIRFVRFSLSYITIFIIAALFCYDANLFSQDLDVPYVPTPQPVVEQMLELGQVGPGDYVVDLGSGDGRIVIAAAKRGAIAHGIDLDPQRIREANQNAEDENITDRAMFINGDIFEEDFTRANVITMYLLSSVNRRLRPQLVGELRPGTRIVSHSFTMGDWAPDRSEEVQPYDSNVTHNIYLWIIPARVGGEWEWEVDGQSQTASIAQNYQEISVQLRSGNRELEISEPVVNGERISFIAQNGNRHYAFSGRVEGDSILGTVQIRRGNESRIENWSATRTMSN